MAFLNIAGEWKESNGTMVNSAVAQLANEFGAMMFNLEHRFYGNSFPTKDLKSHNMIYLSSRQAVEDTANFIQKMSFKYNLRMWILFGCSYAATLVGLIKVKHPNLVAASVAYSAPWIAKADFPEYYQVFSSGVLVLTKVHFTLPNSSCF